MNEKYLGVSDEAVRSATGAGWEDWFHLLDASGAREWPHKRMVTFVSQNGLASGWWQQMVTSTYERVRGIKAVGETHDAMFQIGVQRTIGMPQERLWQMLVTPSGRDLWLGQVRDLRLAKGTPFRTREGTVGEIRSLKEGERIRLTWQPRGFNAPSTLQLTLTCPRNTTSKTTLRFHQERLSSGRQREQMRRHWKAVADQLEQMARLESPPPPTAPSE